MPDRDLTPEVTPQARQFVADLESVQAEGWAELALLYARALSALRVALASRRTLQDRLVEFGRVIGEMDDARAAIAAASHAVGVADAVVTESRARSIRIAERQATCTPVGYITAYRNADDEWSIEFDGEPFATPEQARADLMAAAMSGLPCRTLTLYDEEI